jgi:hypothetical protein
MTYEQIVSFVNELSYKYTGVNPDNKIDLILHDVGHMGFTEDEYKAVKNYIEKHKHELRV